MARLAYRAVAAFAFVSLVIALVGTVVARPSAAPWMSAFTISVIASGMTAPSANVLHGTFATPPVLS